MVDTTHARELQVQLKREKKKLLQFPHTHAGKLKHCRKTTIEAPLDVDIYSGMVLSI